MKITRIGWVGKTQQPFLRESDFDTLELENVYYKKCTKDDWGDLEDWPPRKVRITVEDVEK